MDDAARSWVKTLTPDRRRTVGAMSLWASGKVRLRRWSAHFCRAEVESARERGRVYEVCWGRGGEWSCDCMDYLARGGRCKHIRAVQWTWNAVRDGQERETDG